MFKGLFSSLFGNGEKKKTIEFNFNINVGSKDDQDFVGLKQKVETLEVKIDCKCGNSIGVKLGALQFDPVMVCPKCGETIKVAGDEVRKVLGNIK